MKGPIKKGMFWWTSLGHVWRASICKGPFKGLCKLIKYVRRSILRWTVPPVKKGVQYQGLCPFEDWQVDFTQTPKTRGNFKFVLVLEKATEVEKLPLKEIIPRFGLSHSIQSDNGPSFTSKITQKFGQSQHIKWKWYASWRLQSSIWGDWENESHNKEDPCKNMPGNAFEMGPGTYHCFAPD